MALSLTTLKERIADELHRDDLTDQIADAITTAITYYRSKRLEFNQLSASFNTVASQESYTSGDTGFPTDIGQIDVVRITQSGRRIVLDPMEFSELQARSDSATQTNVPSNYAWYAQKLFLYPIPNGIYAVQLSYQQRKSAPASDADTATVWTNQAEAVIRHCAKKLVRRDVMQDPGYVLSEQAEQEAYAVLVDESRQLQDDGSGLQGSW
jgi:hypothetical protein